jgi:hypothetical protein
MEARLAADEARNKQGFFRIRIKRPRHCYLSRRAPHRGGKAPAGQFLETFLRLQNRARVRRVEMVPGISRVIHHDLSCPCQHSWLPRLGYFFQCSIFEEVPRREAFDQVVAADQKARSSGGIPPLTEYHRSMDFIASVLSSNAGGKVGAHAELASNRDGHHSLGHSDWSSQASAAVYLAEADLELAPALSPPGYSVVLPFERFGICRNVLAPELLH